MKQKQNNAAISIAGSDKNQSPTSINDANSVLRGFPFL
jgi:hypothetical protein